MRFIYFFLLPICTLLFACATKTKLAHEEYVPYRSEITWQCPEFRRFFYSLYTPMNLSPNVMSLLEETDSKVTCEEWEEFKADSQRKAMAMEAEIKARRKLLKPKNRDVVQCRKNYDSSLTCYEYPFYSTYEPSTP